MKQGSVFRRIIDIVWPRDLAAETDYAFSKYVQQEGEVQEHKMLAEYYADKARFINHNSDWWGYAAAMEKAKNHREDAYVLQRRAAVKRETYERLKARLEDKVAKPASQTGLVGRMHGEGWKKV